jgi:hypothetical protein
MSTGGISLLLQSLSGGNKLRFPDKSFRSLTPAPPPSFSMNKQGGARMTDALFEAA